MIKNNKITKTISINYEREIKNLNFLLQQLVGYRKNDTEKIKGKITTLFKSIYDKAFSLYELLEEEKNTKQQDKAITMYKNEYNNYKKIIEQNKINYNNEMKKLHDSFNKKNKEKDKTIKNLTNKIKNQQIENDILKIKLNQIMNGDTVHHAPTTKSYAIGKDNGIFEEIEQLIKSHNLQEVPNNQYNNYLVYRKNNNKKNKNIMQDKKKYNTYGKKIKKKKTLYHLGNYQTTNFIY